MCAEPGIMGHVADQRPDEQPSEEPTTGGEPAGAQPPGQLDPEQLRQFQQFQQFQEFLKFTEAQRGGAGAEMAPGPPNQVVPAHQGAPAPSQQPWPPAQQTGWSPGQAPPYDGQPQLPPARPRTPRWLKWLGKKALGWVVLILLIGLALTWAYNHFFGTSEDEDRPAAETGGGTYHANRILSTKPYEAVRQVYDGIAQNLVPQTCGRFDDAIQQRFAANMGAADCRAAVTQLHAQVTNVNAYAESIPSTTSRPVEGTTMRINSCAFAIEGGPSLGTFTLSKVDRGQWLITGHEPGPTPCPPPIPPGGPVGG